MYFKIQAEHPSRACFSGSQLCAKTKFVQVEPSLRRGGAGAVEVQSGITTLLHSTLVLQLKFSALQSNKLRGTFLDLVEHKRKAQTIHRGNGYQYRHRPTELAEGANLVEIVNGTTES